MGKIVIIGGGWAGCAECCPSERTGRGWAGCAGRCPSGCAGRRRAGCAAAERCGRDESCSSRNSSSKFLK